MMCVQRRPEGATEAITERSRVITDLYIKHHFSPRATALV